MKQIIQVSTFLSLIILLNCNGGPIWTESTLTQACTSNPGQNVISQNPQSKIILDSQNMLLSTSLNMKIYTLDNSLKAFSQDTFRYYIQTATTQGGDSLTNLLIKQLVLQNGNGVGSDPTSLQIQNTYEVIDVDGPLVLLKQTNGGSISLTLNALDNQAVVQIKSIDSSTMANTQVQKIWYLYSQDIVMDNAVGIIQTVNTVSNLVTVYKITNQGGYDINMDTPYYTFTGSSCTSEYYSSQKFCLQFTGSSIHGYRFTALSSTIFTQDATAFAGLDVSSYSNIKVINMQATQLIAMWSNDWKSVISFTVNFTQTQNLVYLDKKQFAATDNPVLLFTDDNSYLLFIDIEGSEFYIAMADQIDGYLYFYDNKQQNDQNSDLILDFSTAKIVMSTFFGKFLATNDEDPYELKRFFYLYSDEKLIKYTLTVDVNSGDTYSINKDYQVVIQQGLKNTLSSQGQNFQVRTSLKCLCSQQTVTDMVCFYGTQECIFTVQSVDSYCTPATSQ